MDTLIILIIILLVAGGVAAAIFGYLAEQKRRAALLNLAHSLGWTFEPGQKRNFGETFTQFDIFKRGQRRRSYNTLRGTLNINQIKCTCQAGDYQYQETHGSGKNRRTSTYRFSYLLLKQPYAGTPQLIIRPENIIDKMAGVFGFDDIDFESAEFSKRFFVKSNDKRFAYNVINPTMLEFLLQSSPPMLQLAHGDACLSDGRKIWSPTEFEHQIHWLRTFFEHWPRHVINELQNKNQ